MTIDGDILEIELDDDLSSVIELKNFVEDRLDYIDQIIIVGDRDTFSSSSLFQLLLSIKKTKPEIKIPIIDEGGLTLSKYGKLHWIR